jgi:hypothetical protein
MDNLQLRRDAKYRLATHNCRKRADLHRCDFQIVAGGNLWEQQRTVIGSRERSADRPRLPASIKKKERS